jgi:aspartate/methionine/tyrosine aminotransferase
MTRRRIGAIVPDPFCHKLRVMFSSRLPARLQPTTLSKAIERARTAGKVRFDLTETNPTRVNLDYPDSLMRAMGDSRSLRYHPEALGSGDARIAIAAHLSAGSRVSEQQLVITASTSEAYSFLFKLLCNPDDEVLVPRPSYPLFDLLTTLDAVRPVHYHLDAAGAWCIDRSSVEAGLSHRTRAVLIVSPNNPTGSMLRGPDREWLVSLAQSRDLALVSDEVFADYPLAVRPDSTSLLGEDRVLTFTLGGLSKSIGLPQMKLAWTAVSGPAERVSEALARLEIIADSYLSVSTPVQTAVGSLLADGREVRRAIQDRLTANLSALRDAVATTPSMTVHLPEGGWSAVVRLPAILSEEQWVVALLEESSVLVHPGFFFDLETEAFVVVSLLPEPRMFAQAIERLCSHVQRVAR